MNNSNQREAYTAYTVSTKIIHFEKRNHLRINVFGESDNSIYPLYVSSNRENEDYKDLMEDILEDLRESIKIAKDAGVKDENIILDPGIGFAKSYEQNLETMNNLEKFNELGYPILLGTSRKSMIGLTLDLPVEKRVEGTIATTVIGIMKGACDFVRVHDVLENSRAAKMTDVIVRR